MMFYKANIITDRTAAIEDVGRIVGPWLNVVSCLLEPIISANPGRVAAFNYEPVHCT